MGIEFQKATFRKTSVKLAVFRSLSQSLEKCKNTKKWPRSHVEAGESCGFILESLRQTQNVTKSVSFIFLH